jgi:hypothetical protein
MIMKDNLEQNKICKDLKIFGKKQKKIMLLFIKTFKLKLDKVDLQYNVKLIKILIIMKKIKKIILTIKTFIYKMKNFIIDIQ